MGEHKTRIETSVPMQVERSGEVVWVCLASVKSRRESPRSVPALPLLGVEDETPSERETKTLLVVQGCGSDPEAAIRDAKERVVRYSSSDDVPPAIVLPLTVTPTLRSRGS